MKGTYESNLPPGNDDTLVLVSVVSRSGQISPGEGSPSRCLRLCSPGPYLSIHDPFDQTLSGWEDSMYDSHRIGHLEHLITEILP